MNDTVIFTDLDGTLLRTSGSVSRYTRDVINLCTAIGVPVIPVTARSSSSAGEVLRWLSAPVPMISQNGAIYFNPRAGGVYREVPIPSDAVEVVISELERHDVPAVADTDQYKAFHPGAAEFIRRLPPSPTKPFGSLREVPLRIFTVIAARGPAAEAAIASIERRTDKLTIARSSAISIDIICRDVSKLRAVTDLCSDFRLDPAQAIAFGDGDNDVDMLRFVGHGIAVGNASAQARAAASTVLQETNDADGVAIYLEELLNRRFGVRLHYRPS